MLENINIDMILSDPLLMSGVVLVILGPIVFIISFFKYISAAKREEDDFVMPIEDEPAPSKSSEDVPMTREEEVSLAQRILLLEDAIVKLRENANPDTPGELTQKLLKLAQHVIVLEKDVTKLKEAVFKQENKDVDKTVQEEKPPIMPL